MLLSLSASCIGSCKFLELVTGKPRHPSVRPYLAYILALCEGGQEQHAGYDDNCTNGDPTKKHAAP